MFHETFVALVEHSSTPYDLSHATKIAVDTYDTLRDLSHETCCISSAMITLMPHLRIGPYKEGVTIVQIQMPFYP